MCLNSPQLVDNCSTLNILLHSHVYCACSETSTTSSIGLLGGKMASIISIVRRYFQSFLSSSHTRSKTAVHSFSTGQKDPQTTAVSSRPFVEREQKIDLCRRPNVKIWFASHYFLNYFLHKVSCLMQFKLQTSCVIFLLTWRFCSYYFFELDTWQNDQQRNRSSEPRRRRCKQNEEEGKEEGMGSSDVVISFDAKSKASECGQVSYFYPKHVIQSQAD